jgi:formimidoylglutamate deiminase
LRLQKLERAVLDEQHDISSALANRLFDCATANGARSIGAPGGVLEPGRPADFFTIDLDDPSIAGVSPKDLLSSIVFSASRAAIREVVIGGKPVVSEGRHLIQDEVIERFNELQKRLWN